MVASICTHVEETLTNMENMSKQFWVDIASILSAIGVIQKKINFLFHIPSMLVTLGKIFLECC